MSSLARMFDILDLFSVARPVVRADDVIRELGYTRATSYRYLKALCDAGFLTLTSDSIYMLGPRILELERMQHLTDPLLRCSQDVVSRLASDTPSSSFLVCSLYRDRVLCVHQGGVDRFVAHGRVLPLARARGLPFPLFSGAASLAILAFLPTYRIRSLYLEKEQEIKVSGLADSWRNFRARMTAIKSAGYALTIGHMNADLAAIAAPIRVGEGQVIGSVARILLREEFVRLNEADCAAQIVAAAETIAAHLASDTTGRQPNGSEARPELASADEPVLVAGRV